LACPTISRSNVNDAPSPIDAVILKRASKIIAKHLANPESVSNLRYNELGVPALVSKDFSNLGGVSTHVRRERLRMKAN
jgi:hypothetical protein